MTRIALPWPAPPLTKNAVRRMHYRTEAKERKAIMETVALLARDTAKHSEAVVVLHWRMADRRRRDGDGAAPTLAACIDGLVQAGVLPDDSWQFVRHSGITCHDPEPDQPGALWLAIDPTT